MAAAIGGNLSPPLATSSQLDEEATRRRLALMHFPWARVETKLPGPSACRRSEQRSTKSGRIQSDRAPGSKYSSCEDSGGGEGQLITMSARTRTRTIPTQMTQKPVLRVEAGARALRNQAEGERVQRPVGALAQVCVSRALKTGNDCTKE